MTFAEIKNKLEEELSTVDVLALEPHFKRQALFMVHKDMDVVELGARVATDDKEFIQTALSAQKLLKVSDEKMQDLLKDKQKQYLFVIVQPFVFAQEILN